MQKTTAQMIIGNIFIRKYLEKKSSLIFLILFTFFSIYNGFNFDRYDLRPFIYPVEWKFQFNCIDKKVLLIEEEESKKAD
jgi:hypothetical protein